MVSGCLGCQPSPGEQRPFLLVTVQSQAAIRGSRQELLRHANGDRIRIHYLP